MVKNVLHWFLLTDLQTGTLVTFTLCIITSEITETVDAVTKTGLLTLAEIRKTELITQMAVTGTVTETWRTCKQSTNDLWIYLGLQNLFFKKDEQFSWLECGCCFTTVQERIYQFFLDQMMLI